MKLSALRSAYKWRKTVPSGGGAAWEPTSSNACRWRLYCTLLAWITKFDYAQTYMSINRRQYFYTADAERTGCSNQHCWHPASGRKWSWPMSSERYIPGIHELPMTCGRPAQSQVWDTGLGESNFFIARVQLSSILRSTWVLDMLSK